MHELHARSILAVLLNRLPQGRIRRVVVDDDYLEIRVVHRLDRFDRVDQYLRGLAVRRNVDRHHRLIGRIRLRKRTSVTRATQTSLT